jgi:hypothetical protein
MRRDWRSRMKINFNNARRRLAENYNQLINTIKYNKDENDKIGLEFLEDALQLLRYSVGIIISTYNNNPDFKDLSEEIELEEFDLK